VLALLATAIALWSWQAPAAEPLPCRQQAGSLGAALCERLNQMHSVCGELDASVRGHCQVCLLANASLLCDEVDDSETAACQRAQALIRRCVASGPSRVDSCLRRSLASLVRFTATARTSPSTPSTIPPEERTSP
jgi:hypothetical protein